MEQTDQAPSALQFETAVSESGTTGVAGVTCTACQRPVLDEYYDVNGQAVCDGCRGTMASHAQTPSGLAPLVRALLLGLGAAVLGAVLHFFITTKFKIGLGAIAIGYMVGYAVRSGARGRGGRRFQVIAALITYWAVGLAYTPILLEAVTGPGAQQQESVGTTDVSVTVTPSAESVPKPALTTSDIGSVLLVIVFFTFSLPVIAVFASLPVGLLSAAIIAFAMRLAWVMTGPPALRISGPYRIGSSAA